MADLKRRKLLFKAKTQSTNSSSGYGGDERHSTEGDGRMHSKKAKITNLFRQHLQKKKKKKLEWEGECRVGVRSRMEKGFASSSSQISFLKGGPASGVFPCSKN
jgi:hypothetical protein